jgi:hypothetical protein
MNRNHLFATAAITALLAGTLPAQAQMLGGGVRGGVSGMQPAAFGGGFATTHAGTRQTDLSASGRAGARVDGPGRVVQTAKTGTQGAARAADAAKADTAAAGRETVGAGEFEASTASDAALGTTRAAAGSTAGISATAPGQGQAQVRNADATGVVAGGPSTTEVSGTRTDAGNSKPSAAQPAKATQPDSPGASRHSSPTRESASSATNSESSGLGTGGETAASAGARGETDANASASVDASTTR